MSIPPARKEQAPQGRENPPSVEPERKAQEPRSRLRMPGWLRWALITLTLCLLAFATFVAQRQAPHPDMFRSVADCDIGKADWWAYPLTLTDSAVLPLEWCTRKLEMCPAGQADTRIMPRAMLGSGWSTQTNP